ncbi:hypothetical protein KUTeg_003962 [Tegillarca granosa]|uniref:Uncharacterized protein n=1 Tax=Tegillarca granosa TaxID=220873 RepID=A0ABQ9FQ84_TEGGR|nr:hypothetical protein KUTeg_003962 [Tegillarca granosa]
MRHDWNSLISDNEKLLFRHYSKDMFPDADIMVRYLNDYADYYKLNIQYNKEMSISVQQKNPDNKEALFYLLDQRQYITKCSNLKSSQYTVQNPSNAEKTETKRARFQTVAVLALDKNAFSVLLLCKLFTGARFQTVAVLAFDKNALTVLLLCQLFTGARFQTVAVLAFDKNAILVLLLCKLFTGARFQTVAVLAFDKNAFSVLLLCQIFTRARDRFQTVAVLAFDKNAFSFLLLYKLFTGDRFQTVAVLAFDKNAFSVLLLCTLFTGARFQTVAVLAFDKNAFSVLLLCKLFTGARFQTVAVLAFDKKALTVLLLCQLFTGARFQTVAVLAFDKYAFSVLLLCKLFTGARFQTVAVLVFDKNAFSVLLLYKLFTGARFQTVAVLAFDKNLFTGARFQTVAVLAFDENAFSVLLLCKLFTGARARFQTVAVLAFDENAFSVLLLCQLFTGAPIDLTTTRLEFGFKFLYSIKVIVATGLSVPNIPEMVGVDFTVGYENISTNPVEYEGKSVLILGRGNSAFETANSIYENTNFVHMVGRERIRLAWETHYVGDLRAVNNGLLDTYQLKSLDGLIEYNDVTNYKIVQENGKLFLRDRKYDERSWEFYDNDPLLMPYDYIIRCLGFHESMFTRGKGRVKKYPVISNDFQSIDTNGLYFAGTNTHSLDFRESAGGFIHGFRYTGNSNVDNQLKSLKPFSKTLIFFHYILTVKSLHHILSWRYHQEPWPSQNVPIHQIVPTIVKRLSETSSLYQMFGFLGDVVVFSKDNKQFEYFEDYPIKLLPQFENTTGVSISDKDVIVIVLQYGNGYKGPMEDVFRLDRAATSARWAHLSNFLHPVLYSYDRKNYSIPKEQLLPRPTRLHHMVEDFNTIWHHPYTHVQPLTTFLENCIDTDLSLYSNEMCALYYMTNKQVPAMCSHYINDRTSVLSLTT